METADVLRLLDNAKRIADALERIAAALEAANTADPLQMIAEAMAMEGNTPVNLDEQLAHPEAWRMG